MPVLWSCLTPIHAFQLLFSGNPVYKRMNHGSFSFHGKARVLAMERMFGPVDRRQISSGRLEFGSCSSRFLLVGLWLLSLKSFSIENFLTCLMSLHRQIVCKDIAGG